MTSGQASILNVKILRFISRREKENSNNYIETNKFLFFSADGQDQPKSRYELLAEQRDYKRRRQSYRAKNVHITKRSAVEVGRTLVGVSVTLEAIVFTYSTLFFKTDISFFRILPRVNSYLY